MIRGERVVLRAIEADDAERCHTWVNDREVTRFLSLRFPIPMADERRWTEATRDPSHDVELAIDTLEGTHIGNCGLHGIDAVARRAELGILIGDKAHWGQGFGTDAMLTLCGFGFGEMNLHRIYLRVIGFNQRAIACYEKCGFLHEGRLRQAEFREGAYHDMLIMGILRDEFGAKWPERLRPA